MTHISIAGCADFKYLMMVMDRADALRPARTSAESERARGARTRGGRRGRPLGTTDAWRVGATRIDGAALSTAAGLSAAARLVSGLASLRIRP